MVKVNPSLLVGIHAYPICRVTWPDRFSGGMLPGPARRTRQVGL